MKPTELMTQMQHNQDDLGQVKIFFKKNTTRFQENSVKFLGMKKSGAFISQAIITNYILTLVFPQSHHTSKFVAVKEQQLTASFFFHKQFSCFFLNQTRSLVSFHVIGKECAPKYESINSFLKKHFLTCPQNSSSLRTQLQYEAYNSSALKGGLQVNHPNSVCLFFF